MPGTSEATNASPSPTPITTGGPRRATTILSGSAADRMPSANAPVSRFTVAAHSVFELDRLAGGFSVLLHLLDQVSNDLGVGLGNKFVPLRGELALQLQIIFNDAVVNDDDAARAVAMGVGVFFGGAAMGSPAGVANAEGAVERVLAQSLFQLGELAGSAAHLKLGPRRTAHGNARRIVTAVFEAP